jgi:3-isopropylmalate/(R)-2-methylmalate dehydratase large subunit
MVSRTLIDKIWDAHLVAEEPGNPAVLYVDLHLLHEVTSPQAFAMLAESNLPVRRPERTVATMDHSTPTLDLPLASLEPAARAQLETLANNCHRHGVRLFDLEAPDRGIVHVMGPELGLTRPGMTIVCGDSHTATHGAFGALAFGIGTSEVGHVLATQCLLQRKPQNMAVVLDGRLANGVTAKDVILALIAQIGVGGGVGHAIEYRGSAIAGFDMDARMTICNMSIEAGARSGAMAPDDVTFTYLADRVDQPTAAWERSVEQWRQLASDDGATYDKTVQLDVGTVEPMITYGTTPAMAVPVGQPVPDPGNLGDAQERAALRDALAYMKLDANRPLAGQPIDAVFIGSCTNGRLADLRAAAKLMTGRRVHQRVRTLVVPGSHAVKRQAEAEGIHHLFTEAGAEWRQPGCSMCLAMNGDMLEPGQIAVSTSNRNFEGRQGPRSRTLLASPLTAAAAAITGEVTDPRSLL